MPGDTWLSIQGCKFLLVRNLHLVAPSGTGLGQTDDWVPAQL